MHHLNLCSLANGETIEVLGNYGSLGGFLFILVPFFLDPFFPLCVDEFGVHLSSTSVGFCFLCSHVEVASDKLITSLLQGTSVPS